MVYSFDPAGTVGVGGARGAWSFDPSVTSVTVTATLRSPNINGWSALSDGWEAVEGDATSATLTVELTAGTCEATTAGGDGGAAAVCRRGGDVGDGDAGGG